MPADILTTHIARDNLNRYLIVGPGNGPAQPYTRVTTIAKTLDDTYNLERWKLRKLALGLTRQPRLVTNAKDLTDDHRRELDRLIDAGLEAGGANELRDYGTLVHTITEEVDRGGSYVRSAPYGDDIAAYLQTTRDAGIVMMPDWIERVVVLDEFKVAGTLDRIVELPDGTRAIADVKTGKNLSPLQIAIQLACYAHADGAYEHMMRTPLPPNVRQDIGLVFHIPAATGTCTIHQIDLEAGWEAFKLAMHVRKTRNSRNLRAEWTPPATRLPQPDQVAVLRARIEQIRDLGFLPQLAVRWPAHIPGFKNGHQHTAEQITELRRIVTDFETDHSIPF